MTTDPRIDAYLATLQPWQADYAQRVRTIIHQAGDDVEETIKRGNWPFFTNAGHNIAAFQGTKDHLNVLIYDPITPDPHALINQGHDNATARAIQIREGEPLDEPALLEFFRAIIASNRAGGWRKLQETT